MKLKIAYLTVFIVAITIPSAFADTVSTEIESANADGIIIVTKSAAAYAIFSFNPR